MPSRVSCRCDIPFGWVEITSDEQARQIGLENAMIPASCLCF
jgi:hypothetical protein